MIALGMLGTDAKKLQKKGELGRLLA